MARLEPQPFREIKRRLEAAGFVEASQKGSHVKFVRRLGGIMDAAIVPKKHEVPRGTLRSILSQAHIDPDDWEKLG
ncbi:MAG TPA: type II toxin-antitoxin system HicA family toxin [Bryobacteraceae bacterium]